MDIKYWEKQFRERVFNIAAADDPAHDGLHFLRVATLAKRFCALEKGLFEVVIPAAWLHDMVIIPKDNPLRNQASRLSAEKALVYLKSINYPEEFYVNIAHSITAHSFSANIPADTLEAKIVQDADRLDGLGAIGIARCFATAGLLKRAFYHPKDPFCSNRSPDDAVFTIDHFYQKLFKTAASLHTEAGKIEGQKRINMMKSFLATLHSEISHIAEPLPLDKGSNLGNPLI